MDEKLPERVDVVVIGTGLPESILASACARSGLNVLHLDRSEFYGGDWASFNLRTIEEWIESKERVTPIVEESIKEKYTELVGDGETLSVLPSNKQIKDIRREWSAESTQLTTVATKNGESVEKTLKEAIEDEWRRFSIDIAPKVLLACGPMVKTLCDSEVAKYAEFKCVDRLLCVDDFSASSMSFSRVPCSRGDIFESESLSMLDKRRLMKFMQFCLKWNSKSEEMDEWKAFADKPFVDFLQSLDIFGTLQSYIANAIGILQPNANTKQGLTAVCRFVDSVGRFGSSPFLAPLYGCGELPQCFCRLCAVFGGLYCLGRPVEAIIEKENRVVAVIADGQRVNCSHLIVSPEFSPSTFGTQSDEEMQRTIVISKKSVCEAEKEHISLFSLAEIAPQAAPRLFESGFECCQAPKGYFVSQITSRRTEEEYVDSLIEKLYGNGEEGDARPLHLWSLRFSVRSAPFQMAQSAPENVAVVPSPDESLDYADVIRTSEEIFTKFWPDRDFLPRSLKKNEEEELDSVENPESAEAREIVEE